LRKLFVNMVFITSFLVVWQEFMIFVLFFFFFPQKEYLLFIDWAEYQNTKIKILRTGIHGDSANFLKQIYL